MEEKQQLAENEVQGLFESVLAEDREPAENKTLNESLKTY